MAIGILAAGATGLARVLGGLGGGVARTLGLGAASAGRGAIRGVGEVVPTATRISAGVARTGPTAAKSLASVNQSARAFVTRTTSVSTMGSLRTLGSTPGASARSFQRQASASIARDMGKVEQIGGKAAASQSLGRSLVDKLNETVTVTGNAVKSVLSKVRGYKRVRVADLAKGAIPTSIGVSGRVGGLVKAGKKAAKFLTAKKLVKVRKERIAPEGLEEAVDNIKTTIKESLGMESFFGGGVSIPREIVRRNTKVGEARYAGKGGRSIPTIPTTDRPTGVLPSQIAYPRTYSQKPAQRLGVFQPNEWRIRQYFRTGDEVRRLYRYALGWKDLGLSRRERIIWANDVASKYRYLRDRFGREAAPIFRPWIGLDSPFRTVSATVGGLAFSSNNTLDLVDRRPFPLVRFRVTLARAHEAPRYVIMQYLLRDRLNRATADSLESTLQGIAPSAYRSNIEVEPAENDFLNIMAPPWAFSMSPSSWKAQTYFNSALQLVRANYAAQAAGIWAKLLSEFRWRT